MLTEDSLIRLTPQGLYCEAGDFHIDPWRSVDRAVTTHAHADHLCRGCKHYLAAREGEEVLRIRIGWDAALETVPYGEPVHLNGVRVSFHPAGHILGSAQIRVEKDGEIWVISGDYKTHSDPTCAQFEPIRCHTFVTESTFGLPIYRWPDPSTVFESINQWWRGNAEAGKASVIFGYALGKAQRILAGVDTSIGPIYTHGAVQVFNDAYINRGIKLIDTATASSQPPKTDWRKALIIAPPSAHNTPWTRKFGTHSTAFASGWMQIRGTRRRRAVDRGFILSDHVDWPGLIDTIRATGAEHIWVTHGYTTPVVRWLQEQGLDAQIVPTRYEGEQDNAVDNLEVEE